MKWVSWLRENWKELAIPAAIAALTALFGFTFWARGVILLQGHMIEDAKKQNEDMQAQVETLRKWAGCQERQEITGKSYKFNWPTLECIEQAGNAPVTADTLERWVDCQEREGLTDERYRFDWQNLECIEPPEAGNAPVNPVP